MSPGRVFLDPRRLVFVGTKRELASLRRLLAEWPRQTTQLDALRQLRGDLVALATGPVSTANE